MYLEEGSVEVGRLSSQPTLLHSTISPQLSVLVDEYQQKTTIIRKITSRSFDPCCYLYWFSSGCGDIVLRSKVERFGGRVWEGAFRSSRERKRAREKESERESGVEGEGGRVKRVFGIFIIIIIIILTKK
jgi:hypothetical protein